MLTSMADSNSELPATFQRKKGKGGISVQDLGYNVIFNGGERTLEKFPELTIDLQKFEQEADPLFKDRTQKFDGGMLLQSLNVDRGLLLQLDSELAQKSKETIHDFTVRLPQKGTPANLLQA